MDGEVPHSHHHLPAPSATLHHPALLALLPQHSHQLGHVFLLEGVEVVSEELGHLLSAQLFQQLFNLPRQLAALALIHQHQGLHKLVNLFFRHFFSSHYFNSCLLKLSLFFTLSRSIDLWASRYF